MPHRCRLLTGVIGLMALGACQNGREASSTALSAIAAPSILLVTLDTTRADAIGPEARGLETPAFSAISRRGRRFRQAYATVPETLPSHISMMTGLYPAGHGVHENGRHLRATHPVLAALLQDAGYRTAAFVSSFVLARRFGLARGFEIYDDEQPQGRPERTSRETTDRVLAYLSQRSQRPLFIWVHYFDPHSPYRPPEAFVRRYADTPYLGEVAAMDEQLGRLVQAFEQQTPGPQAIVIASDHGEGLGEHGESQHGNLLYQSTMHVPLVVIGPGIAPDVSDTPISTRRIYHTILDFAGVDPSQSLRTPDAGGLPDVILGEAMKPFLNYGWQPQIMAVDGRQKAIFAGKTEVYDLAADSAEMRSVGGIANLPPRMRKALDEYPVPSAEASRTPENLSDEARRSLASLGYVGASAAPVIRRDAPRPVEMAHLFDVIERASGLFVEEQYARAIPLLQQILTADPHNLDAALRLATAHSALGHERQALEAFRKAAVIAPRSPDVRVYLALHHARGKHWERAVPDLERIVAESPERLPAVEALAVIRERQGRTAEAIAWRQRVYALRDPTVAELVQMGRLAMDVQQTELAIQSFEKARRLHGAGFTHDMELGVLYLAARKFEEARTALDRVPPSHPEYPLALFKRAQVSVLLNEADRAARIETARRRADSTTRQLIAKERLFQDVRRP